MAGHTRIHGSEDHGGTVGGWASTSFVTTDQTPATTDAGTLYRYTVATTTNRTITLPSVGSSDDGIMFWVENDSMYTITVKPSDSDSVWTAGSGYGITLFRKSLVCLKYNDTTTNWEIIYNNNCNVGLISIEGLKCHISDFGISNGKIKDDAKRHLITATSTSTIIESSIWKFGPSSLYFGESDYVSIASLSTVTSADFNIFSSTSTNVTLETWVYFVDSSTLEHIFGFYEDSNNYWSLLRNTSNQLNFEYKSGGTSYINMTAGTLTNETWYHVVYCKKGAESGLYLNGTQIAYDATFTTDTLTATYFQIGNINSTNRLNGRINAFTLTHSNPYNLAPNSGLTNTISSWNTSTRLNPVL